MSGTIVRASIHSLVLLTMILCGRRSYSISQIRKLRPSRAKNVTADLSTSQSCDLSSFMPDAS